MPESRLQNPKWFHTSVFVYICIWTDSHDSIESDSQANELIRFQLNINSMEKKSFFVQFIYTKKIFTAVENNIN